MTLIQSSGCSSSEADRYIRLRLVAVEKYSKLDVSWWIKVDSHLRRAFRGVMKLCRIENFHFHDLRHTFATRLVQGTDLYKESTQNLTTAA